MFLFCMFIYNNHGCFSFPEVKTETGKRLQDKLLSCKFRIQSRTLRVWIVEVGVCLSYCLVSLLPVHSVIMIYNYNLHT